MSWEWMFALHLNGCLIACALTARRFIAISIRESSDLRSSLGGPRRREEQDEKHSISKKAPPEAHGGADDVELKIHRASILSSRQWGKTHRKSFPFLTFQNTTWFDPSLRLNIFNHSNDVFAVWKEIDCLSKKKNHFRKINNWCYHWHQNIQKCWGMFSEKYYFVGSECKRVEVLLLVVLLEFSFLLQAFQTFLNTLWKTKSNECSD